jgi:TetR/AcrR family transcriptional regulator, regulator of cefoperazone and chloramphenicol sensitivity
VIDLGVAKVNDETTRDRILRTAGPIFAERGFRDATVRDICDAAGVNLASINYYFGDKARLYVEVVRFARASQDLIYAVPGEGVAQDPQEQLFQFIQALLRRLGLDHWANWQTQLLVREFLEPGEATRTVAEQYFRPAFERLMILLDELAGAEREKDDRALAAFSVLGQCLFYKLSGPVIEMFEGAAVPGDRISLDRVARHITDFTVFGLTGGKTGPRAPRAVGRA